MLISISRRMEKIARWNSPSNPISTFLHSTAIHTRRPSPTQCNYLPAISLLIRKSISLPQSIIVFPPRDVGKFSPLCNAHFPDCLSIPRSRPRAFPHRHIAVLTLLYESADDGDFRRRLSTMTTTTTSTTEATMTGSWRLDGFEAHHQLCACPHQLICKKK